MNNSYLFRHGPSNTVESRELADSMGGDETAGAVHSSGIAIGGVCGVELIGVADPIQAFDVVYVIEESEVEISRNAEDSVDADLLDASPEV
jgi:hypothetical protein